MAIQEVLTYAGPLDAGSGQRGPELAGERRENLRDGDMDRFTVSGQAIALYEAERTSRFDVVRERVRAGYYLKNDVLDHVVDALAKEVSRENAVRAIL